MRCPVLFFCCGEGSRRHVWAGAAGKCEDFAPRNEDTRVRGEQGAKRGGRRSRGRVKSGGGNVKILLPGTEPQGFAGSGEQREEAAGRAEGRNPAAGM